jgi:tetratricopeptide (TPR) repeat protein
MLAIIACCLAGSTGCGDRAGPDRPDSDIPIPDDLDRITESRLRDAVMESRRFVAANRGSAKAWASLAHLYLAHGWDDYAAPCYESAAEIEPDDFRWRYYIARSLERDDWDAAARAYEQAIERNPDYAPAHLFLGLLHMKLGRDNLAKDRFENSLKLDPQIALAETRLGQIALSQGRLSDAQTHLERAVEINPGQSEAYASLAQLCSGRNQHERANAYADSARKPPVKQPIRDPLIEAMELAGITSQWLASRGSKLLQDGDILNGAKALREAASANPNDPTIWMNYGLALARMERHREAISALERSLEASAALPSAERLSIESEAKIHLRLGVIYAISGNTDKAESHLSRAIEKQPTDPEPRFLLAVLYRGQSRGDEAIAQLQEARKIRFDKRVSGLLIKLLRDAGRLEEAQEVQDEFAARGRGTMPGF